MSAATLEDVDLTRDPILQQFLQAHHHRRARRVEHVHVEAEARFQIGQAVERFLQQLRIDIAAARDEHDADLLVAFVAHILEDRDLLVRDDLRDLFDQLALGHLVGDFADDELPLAAAQPLDTRLAVRRIRSLCGMEARADAEAAAPGLIGCADGFRAVHDQAARGEVRALHQLHQLAMFDRRILDHSERRVDHFRDVVAGDVRRHAHRDPAGPVGEQVGEQAGEDDRLFFLVVVGRHEIDRALVQPRHQGHRGPGQARFGVAGGSGIIAVDIAEVALPLNQRVAQRKGLREADHRIVHGGIAMRVVLAQHLTHHAGGFLVRRVGPKPQLAHRPQQAAVDRFQPVAKIGQRTCGDRGQGIDEIPLGQRGLERRIDNCSGGIGLRGALIFGSHRLALPPARLGQKRGTQSFPRPFSP